MRNFFKDLKIIELASVLAGPSAGMFFAELGAEVVKVENKRTGGDAVRGWRLPDETKSGPSAYFCAVNFGKTYLPLDLKDPADREHLNRLLTDADIVLSNYREETARKLGLRYADLTEVNPHVIHIGLDGFSGSDKAAYDVVLQAETGWISMTGADADHPAKLPVALIDILAGHQMKEAALLALISRERTGKGADIRVSLEKSSLAALANQATNYLMCGHVAKPIGTLHPNIAPYGDSFITADGRRTVTAVGSDAQFEKLCTVLGIKDAASDPRFGTNTDRTKNREALTAILAPAFLRADAAHWDSAMSAAGVPCGTVRRLDEVLESDAAREMRLEDEIEGRKASRLSGIGFSVNSLGPS